MIGQTFGLWTVESLASSGGAYVNARCACGTRRTVHASSLRLGKSKSCRCLSIPDIVGQTIGGRWVVLKHIGPKSFFQVRCLICGTEREMRATDLYSTGSHKRCMCKMKEAKRRG